MSSSKTSRRDTDDSDFRFLDPSGGILARAAQSINTTNTPPMAADKTRSAWDPSKRIPKKRRLFQTKDNPLARAQENQSQDRQSRLRYGQSTLRRQQVRPPTRRGGGNKTIDVFGEGLPFPTRSMKVVTENLRQRHKRPAQDATDHEVSSPVTPPGNSNGSKSDHEVVDLCDDDDDDDGNDKSNGYPPSVRTDKGIPETPSAHSTKSFASTDAVPGSGGSRRKRRKKGMTAREKRKSLEHEWRDSASDDSTSKDQGFWQREPQDMRQQPRTVSKSPEHEDLSICSSPESKATALNVCQLSDGYAGDVVDAAMDVIRSQPTVAVLSERRESRPRLRKQGKNKTSGLVVSKQNSYGKRKRAVAIVPGRSLEMSRDVESIESSGSWESRPKRPRESDAKEATQYEIIDDDEHKESVRTRQSPHLRKETKLEATRATVGKLASSEGCKLVFEATSGTFTLEYLKKEKHQRIDFRVDDIEELFYHIGKEGDVSPAEQLTFLGFRVKPSKKNGLDMLKNSYLQSREDVNDTVTNRERKYITIEPRSTGDFQTELLEDMKKNDVIAAFLQSGEILGKNDEAEKVRYKAPRLLRMVENEYNEREEAMSSPRKRRTRSIKAEKELNQTILVFPFGGDDEKIVAAAKGLHEAKKVFGGSAPRLHVSNASSASSSSSSSSSDEHEVEETEKAEEKSNQRGHYLTISTEDRDRLAEREFLNDTLIDFWMQWLLHKQDRETCSVYVFTSHFYTTLSEEGPAAVESWTARKNVDIFTKKFVFIPVNKHLHWSLCVVVNPSAILNGHAQKASSDSLYPCILFLDSLGAHKKTTVAKAVRRWLHSEWKRLKKGEKDEENLFTASAMPVHDPKVPYQNNSWDCGVYVCRYAYALFMSRDRRITFRDLHFGDTKKPFRDAITQNKEFKFGGKDIRRLRDEMGVLIDRLGELYKVWKRKTEAEAEADNQDLTPEAEVLAETVVAEKVAVTTEFKPVDAKDGTKNKRIKVEADQAEEAETAEEKREQTKRIKVEADQAEEAETAEGKREQTKRIKVESDQAETAMEKSDEMEDVVKVETVAEKAKAKGRRPLNQKIKMEGRLKLRKLQMEVESVDQDYRSASPRSENAQPVALDM